jgi:hypothetical protein
MFNKKQSSSLSGTFKEHVILSFATSKSWHGNDSEYQQTRLSGFQTGHQWIQIYLHYGATDDHSQGTPAGNPTHCITS